MVSGKEDHHQPGLIAGGRLCGGLLQDVWRPGKGLTPAAGTGIENDIFGQKLALEKLKSILQTDGHSPRMISIHGGSGTGKTYTFQLLRDKIYFAKQSTSYYYKYYSGNEFEYSSNDPFAITQLQIEISRAARCPFSLIVFDEADRFPADFLYQLLLPIISYKNRKKGPVPTIIFISNVGADEILSGFNDGFSDISYYEDLLKKSIQHKQDFFSKSSLVTNGYINDFIPYLPLEEDSVERCIKAALNKLWLSSDSKVQKIKNQLIFKVTPGWFFYKKYSLFGCKNIMNEINLLQYRDEL